MAEKRKLHCLTKERAEELADVLEKELRHIRQGEYSPLAKHIPLARPQSPIDSHLMSMILRRMGHNRELAEEIIEKISPRSKERLFRIFQDLEHEMQSEKQKRKRGQWWS